MRRQCPTCGVLIEDETDAFCDLCGTRLPERVVPESHMVTRHRVGGRHEAVVSIRGTDHSTAVDFIPLRDDPSRARERSRRRSDHPRRRLWIAAAVLGLIALVSAAGYVYLQRAGDSPAQQPSLAVVAGTGSMPDPTAPGDSGGHAVASTTTPARLGSTPTATVRTPTVTAMTATGAGVPTTQPTVTATSTAPGRATTPVDELAGLSQPTSPPTPTPAPSVTPSPTSLPLPPNRPSSSLPI